MSDSELDSYVDSHVLDGVMKLAVGDVRELKQVASDIYARRKHMTAEEAVKKAAFGSILMSRRTGIDSIAIAQEMVPFFGALFMWARDGFPHFSLTSDFFSAIAVTDFGDPTDDPLLMPFDSFTVSFPKTDLFNGASRAIVYKIPSVSGPMSGTSHTEFSVDWKLYRATLLCDDPIFTQWGIGMTRKQLLEQENVLNATADTPGVRPIEEEEKPLLGRLRVMLANVLSYIEASGPLPSIPRKKGATPEPVERIHPVQPNFDVGRTVKLDGGLREAMRAGVADKAAWKLAQRFIVRGHWRNQAHGEGRTLRKRIWVAPFWKGPENVVEALSRTYEVG